MYFVIILSVCLLGSVIVNGNVNGQRIAGGDPVEIQQYPFAAALVTNGGQGTSYSHACGGTILTNRAILSAASCFYTNAEAHPANRWRARVGTTYSNSGGTIYLISSITPNPDFSPTTLVNDIAVLRTTLVMALVPGSVEVARVSGPSYTFALNQVVTAIGWGATSNNDPSSSRELRQVDVYTINHTTCSNRWNALTFTVTDNMVCTGWLDVGVIGQCTGDVGSPLLDKEGSFVVGVFSRAEGCGQGWYPDVNTQLQPYLSWVIGAAYQ